jgi:hypothetical protein
MKNLFYLKSEDIEADKILVGETGTENFTSFRVSVLKISGFLLFAACCLLLLLLNSFLGLWILILTALPSYLFLEWLSRKVFNQKYGWSTSQVGFSITRIIFGILLALAFFGVIWLLLTK